MQQKGGYKSLVILFAALFIGQLFFLGIALWYVQQKNINSHAHEIKNVLLPLSAIVALTGLITGYRLFKKRISNPGDIQQSLSDRFDAYRAACIMRWALLEGPCLLAIIGLMITGDNLFLLIASALLVIFIATIPRKNKVASDLGINEEQLDKMS